jgi:transcriptional regulator with PAS, ATPase and Fis domain
VLIEGETGTGKEVIARLIHYGKLDGASIHPFVDINCAALSSSLFESELFGYEAGAFTGSRVKGQRGKLDIATGGTLFLDEIGEIALELQAKFLRVIQEKEFYRVGGIKKISTNVRLICASNVSLEQMVEKNQFRRDLFYRLKVGYIRIPPLRERRGDINLNAPKIDGAQNGWIMLVVTSPKL